MTSVQIGNNISQGSIRNFMQRAQPGFIQAVQLPDISASVQLGQNYPDPFVSIAIIPVTLHENCHVLLEIFDAQGLKMMTLLDGWESAGETTVVLDRTMLIPGTYRYQLTAATNTGKKVLSRYLTIL